MRLQTLMPSLLRLAGTGVVTAAAWQPAARCAPGDSPPEAGPSPRSPHPPLRPTPPAPQLPAGRDAPPAPQAAVSPRAPAVDAAMFAVHQKAAAAMGASEPLEQSLYAAVLAAVPPARRAILEQVGQEYRRHSERCTLATLRQLAALCDEDLVAVGQLARASKQLGSSDVTFELPRLVETFVALPARLRGLAAEAIAGIPDADRGYVNREDRVKFLFESRLALHALRRHPHVDADVCRRLWRQPEAHRRLAEVIFEVAAAGNVDVGHLDAAQARLRRLGYDPDACQVLYYVGRVHPDHGNWDVLLRAEATHPPALARAIETIHAAVTGHRGNVTLYRDVVAACGRHPAAHVQALATSLEDRSCADGALNLDDVSALLTLPPGEAAALLDLLGPGRHGLSQAATWAAVPAALRGPLHALLAGERAGSVAEVAALPPQDAERAARRGTQLLALAENAYPPENFWRGCLAVSDEASWQRGVERLPEWLGDRRERRVSGAELLRLHRVLAEASVPLPSGEDKRRILQLGDPAGLLQAWCALDPGQASAALRAVAGFIGERGSTRRDAASPGELLALVASYERRFRNLGRQSQ